MPTLTKRVVCYGDSTAAGWGVPRNRGCAALLGEHFYGLNPWGPEGYSFDNLAVAAETSTTFLHRAALETRRSEDEGILSLRYPPGVTCLSVVAIGGAQDVYREVRDGQDPTTEEARDRYTATIGEATMLLARVSNLLFIGTPNPHPDIANRRIRSNPKYSIGDVIGEHEALTIDIMADTARQAGRSFAAVRLYGRYGKNGREGWTKGGTHPDETGQKRIFDRVRPAFDEIAGAYTGDLKEMLELGLVDEILATYPGLTRQHIDDYYDKIRRIDHELCY